MHSHPLTRSGRWTIVGPLCAGKMIAYLDRVNLSVALADLRFRGFFDLTDSQRGWLNSVFFWSYMLFRIPAGWVVDRFGIRRPYDLGFLLWSAVSAACALSFSARQLFTLRLLLGVGESVITPTGMNWIRRHYAEH